MKPQESLVFLDEDAAKNVGEVQVFHEKIKKTKSSRLETVLLEMSREEIFSDFSKELKFASQIVESAKTLKGLSRENVSRHAKEFSLFEILVELEKFEFSSKEKA